MVKSKEREGQPVQLPPGKWNARSAILLFVLGLSLIVLIPSMPIALTAEEAPKREESRFAIYVDGKEIGSEQFSILTSADAVDSTSVVSFRDPGKSRKKVRMETQLSMDSRFMPRSYLVRTDVEGQKGTITGTFVPGEATFDYQGSGNPMRRGLLVGDRYVLLDTNIFHHFVLLARLYDLRAGGNQTIEAVIPQELDSGKLKVSEVGLEQLSIRGKKMNLHHLTADSGMLLINLWVDDQKILYKIELPAKKIEVIRGR